MLRRKQHRMSSPFHLQSTVGERSSSSIKCNENNYKSPQWNTSWITESIVRGRNSVVLCPASLAGARPQLVIWIFWGSGHATSGITKFGTICPMSSLSRTTAPSALRMQPSKERPAACFAVFRACRALPRKQFDRMRKCAITSLKC